jgi:hypothetical protein
MKFSDYEKKLRELLGLDGHAVAKRGTSYNRYIQLMEEMRRNWGRMRNNYGRVYDPIHGKIVQLEPSDEPMPIDLKAYIIVQQYDGDKRTFSKIIPELVKHKDELHPFMRRYLLEQLRASENKYRQLAERFGAVADQFEIEDQPQSVSRDIAVAKRA